MSICYCVNVVFHVGRIEWDFMLHVELINNNSGRDSDQSKEYIWKCERVKGFIYHVFYLFSFLVSMSNFRAHATSTAEFIVLHFAHHRSLNGADASYGNDRMNRIPKIQLHATVNGPFGIDRISSDN